MCVIASKMRAALPTLLALVLCVIFSISDGEILIKGVSQSSGLTASEKKALLDEHNFLRSLQAQGKIPGHPSAADMVRLVSTTLEIICLYPNAIFRKSPL